MVAVNRRIEAFRETAFDWLQLLERELSPELIRVSKALDNQSFPDAGDAIKIAAMVSGAMDAFRMSGAFKNA